MTGSRTLPVATVVLRAAADLSSSLDGLRFPSPVAYVYNPLAYAFAPYQAYIERWVNQPCRVVFLGMNPGPWGMAQVGVPFGEIGMVRDWLGIDAPVGRPPLAHPAKPVDGFACRRSEVSGRRLWGLFASRFGSAGDFFREHAVINYCPLLFLDHRGRNLTPDKLPRATRLELDRACDDHLRAVIRVLRPEWLVGVGKYAVRQAGRALPGGWCRIAGLLHPSPASPLANRGWPETAVEQLANQGVWRPAGSKDH